MSTNTTNNGDGYATQLDAELSQAVSKWWNNLSKHELLMYLDEQKSVTADQLRQMLANEATCLNLGLTFSVVNGEAVTDFQKRADK